MTKQLERARLYLEMASKDEGLLRIIESSREKGQDSNFGFHAQQAAEKLFKALLSAKGISFDKVHDLVWLRELLTKSGEAVPQALEEIDFLYPYAVRYRYEQLPESEAPIDQAKTRELLAALRTWVEGRIDAVEPE